jgi:hypothetical protein
MDSTLASEGEPLALPFTDEWFWVLLESLSNQNRWSIASLPRCSYYIQS